MHLFMFQHILYFDTEFTGLRKTYLARIKPSLSFLWRVCYVCRPWRAEC